MRTVASWQARALMKLLSHSGGDEAGAAGSVEGRIIQESSLESSATTIANASRGQGRPSGASLWLGA